MDASATVPVKWVSKIEDITEPPVISQPSNEAVRPGCTCPRSRLGLPPLPFPAKKKKKKEQGESDKRGPES